MLQPIEEKEQIIYYDPVLTLINRLNTESNMKITCIAIGNINGIGKGKNQYPKGVY